MESSSRSQKESKECPSSSWRDRDGVNLAEGTLLCGAHHHQTTQRQDLRCFSFLLGLRLSSGGDTWLSSFFSWAPEAAETCSEEVSLEYGLRGGMAEIFSFQPWGRRWLGQMSSREHGKEARVVVVAHLGPTKDSWSCMKKTSRCYASSGFMQAMPAAWLTCLNHWQEPG